VAYFTVLMAGKSEDSIERKGKSVNGYTFIQNHPSPTSSVYILSILTRLLAFRGLLDVCTLTMHGDPNKPVGL